MPRGGEGPNRLPRLGASARDITGVDVNGRPVEVPLGSGRSGVIFLTSSCPPCQAIWGSASTDLALYLVTPSPTTESRRQVARLAPPGVTVVMSSEAWHEYGVGRAPWLVVVEDGRVAFDGPSPDGWPAVERAVRGN
jgi:hypothetical protein